MDIIIVVVLILFSGVFSGLTIGFFSLSRGDLERKAELGNRAAKRVFALRRDGNLLLSTLIVANVGVNSAISLFLKSVLTTGITAGIIATALIVLFGEILPQATFSRFALAFGARLAWFVRAIELALYPICKPIALLLDKFLGSELPTVYSKKELVKMIEDHEESSRSDIDKEDVRILSGVLAYSEKRVGDIMTSVNDVTMALDTTRLTKKNVRNIRLSGHSRIPVYRKRKDNIVGILYLKDLVAHIDEHKTAYDVARKKVIFVDSRERLDNVLNDFTKTRRHLFVVMSRKSVIGVISIEDILEEIIGAEIVDEYDLDEVPDQKK